MKATSIIIAAVLTLQVSFLFADNNDIRSTVNDETVLCPTCVLAPVTPTEATLKETTVPNIFGLDLTSLSPVTPVEVDFTDVVPEKKLDLTILSPVTPAVADFDEIIDVPVINLTVLAPVSPSEADFE